MSVRAYMHSMPSFSMYFNIYTLLASFYPSFRMYFNLLTLLVHTSLIMKRAPVFRTGSLAFVAFNLNKMG